MSDEQEVRPGFLPPRAPGAAAPPTLDRPAVPPQWTPPRPPEGTTPPGAAPDRPTFVTAGRPDGPSNPMAVASIVIACISIGLLVVSVGVAYALSALLASVALGMGVSVRRRLTAGAAGRPAQARAAVVIASVALGLAIGAAIVWLALESSGFSPQDLERWLEDQLERQRDRREAPGGELA